MLKLLLLKKAILGWWLFQYLSMFGIIARCLLLIKAPSISNQHIFSTDFLKTLKKYMSVKKKSSDEINLVEKLFEGRLYEELI